MAISFVDKSLSKVDDGSSNTTITGTLPAGGSDGNLLVAFIASGDGGNPGSLTAPSGWTLVRHNYDGTFGEYSNGNFTAHCGVAYATRAAAMDLTFTINAAGQDDQLIIAEFSGDWDATTPVDLSSFNSSHDGVDDLTCPTLTTTVDGSVLVCCAAHDPGDSALADDTGEPSGMTMVYNRRTANGASSARVRSAMAYEVIATAGATGTRTWVDFGDDLYSKGVSFVINHSEGAGTPTVDADASTTPGDTVNHSVTNFGGTINSATLSDGTSTITLTSPGNTSAVMPAAGDGVQFTTFGSARTYTVGDGTDTATDTVDLNPDAGDTLVTLTASPSTAETSWLYNYGVAPVAGDQAVYDPVASDTGETLTLGADGSWSSTGSGNWTITVVDATDGWMETLSFRAVGIVSSPSVISPGDVYNINLDLGVTISSVTLDGEVQSIDSQSTTGNTTTVNLQAAQGNVKFGTDLTIAANISGGGLADASIDFVPIEGNDYVNPTGISTTTDSVFSTGRLDTAEVGDQVEYDDASNTTISIDGTISQTTARDFQARLWDATSGTWGAWTAITMVEETPVEEVPQNTGAVDKRATFAPESTSDVFTVRVNRLRTFVQIAVEEVSLENLTVKVVPYNTRISHTVTFPAGTGKVGVIKDLSIQEIKISGMPSGANYHITVSQLE